MKMNTFHRDMTLSSRAEGDTSASLRRRELFRSRGSAVARGRSS